MKNNRPNNLAIIDCGTNSVRFYVFDIDKNGKFVPRCKEKIMIRLGDGLFDDNKLTPEAKQRGVAAFKYFQVLISQFKPETVRAIATSALREANDSAEFVDEVRRETGIEIDVISEEEEARLIAVGVTSGVYEVHGEPLVLVDIGGGSTEISLCHGADIEFSASLRFGAARSQQNYLKNSPPKNGSQLKLRQALNDKLKEFSPRFPFASAQRLIGSSGSIRALGKVCTHTAGENGPFDRGDLEAFIKRIEVLDKSQLALIPELEPRRVDLILAAAVILDEIAAYFGAAEIIPTSRSLVDGILHDSFLLSA
ncbi:MAG: hypothetical protein KDD66_02555 [Bdellovibrionales bacterium]|nr:hypothetical protein [Bdellovibrionales bacterium]